MFHHDPFSTPHKVARTSPRAAWLQTVFPAREVSVFRLQQRDPGTMSGHVSATAKHLSWRQPELPAPQTTCAGCAARGGRCAGAGTGTGSLCWVPCQAGSAGRQLAPGWPMPASPHGRPLLSLARAGAAGGCPRRCVPCARDVPLLTAKCAPRAVAPPNVHCAARGGGDR